MNLKKLYHAINEAEETINNKVRDWYMSEYKDDEIGKDINPDITFADVDKDLRNVYDVLGVGDSIIRERVFEKLSEIKGVDYDDIYYAWLGTEKQDKIEFPKLIQCVLKIKDIGNEYQYEGMIEDNSNYKSEYDMEVEFSDRLDLETQEDPTIQFILAYHYDGKDDKFFAEDGSELNLNMDRYNEFKKAVEKPLDNPTVPNSIEDI